MDAIKCFLNFLPSDLFFFPENNIQMMKKGAQIIPKIYTMRATIMADENVKLKRFKIE